MKTAGFIGGNEDLEYNVPALMTVVRSEIGVRRRMKGLKALIQA